MVEKEERRMKLLLHLFEFCLFVLLFPLYFFWNILRGILGLYSEEEIDKGTAYYLRRHKRPLTKDTWEEVDGDTKSDEYHREHYCDD